MSGKYLYLVEIARGRDNRYWKRFYENVTALNAKAPDFSGITRTVLIAHHMDAKAVHVLCSIGIRQPAEVEVTEITRESIEEPDTGHRVYSELIDNYFRPFDHFENL